jgi:allophanate hydrolase
VQIPEDEVTVRYVPGPQTDWFTDEAEGVFTSSAYRVSVHSDRAGIRLEGPALRHRDRADILSDGMLPGAIQVPGGGQPIVIMPDGPTTGGYPKIGVIIAADLRLLAQARPGTKVRFAAR